MAYTVEDFLVEQSPMIGTDINQKMLDQPTPWITLYKQETWEDERSNTQKTFQFDRAKIVDPSNTLNDDMVDEVEWADVAAGISANDNTANHQANNAFSADGIPPSDNVEFTQTLRSYNLQHKAIWGPPMNVNQLRDKFIRTQQMNACVTALADQAREFWINRKRREYTRIADNLVVLDSGFSLTGGKYNTLAFPSATGTDSSILSNGFTDMLYEYMNHQGGAKGALGTADGRPVYGLVTSPRQSRRLIMADPEVREDFRYSDQNQKLLAAMGVKYQYNGFSHITDEKTNRWEWVVGSGNVTVAGTTLTLASTPASPFATSGFFKGSQIIANGGANIYIVTKRLSATTYTVVNADGTAPTSLTATANYTAWVSIPQFVVKQVSGVYKRVPNPAWLTATWEDSYVFHQGVCTSLVPKPLTSVGQAQFSAVNYSGTFKWTKYENRADNPDGTIGQFRGVMSNGTRPDNPEFGIVIRHLAVPNASGRIIDGSSLG